MTQLGHHHNATFIALATDGEGCVVGISEHGGAATRTLDSLDHVFALIVQNVAECVDADRPLIVVVGKNKTRATAGEVFLEAFALDIVRSTIDALPEDTFVYAGGCAVSVQNTYFHPRVVSTPLVWATKSTPIEKRLGILLDELAFTDFGVQYIPQGRTHAGA